MGIVCRLVIVSRVLLPCYSRSFYLNNTDFKESLLLYITKILLSCLFRHTMDLLNVTDMAQFLLMRYEAGEVTNITNRKIESGFRKDSIAYLHFFLERQTGYFLLQYYTPLVVIVMCSWVVSII